MACDHKGCHCNETVIEQNGKNYCSERCAEIDFGRDQGRSVRLRSSRLRRSVEGARTMRPIWNGHISFGLISIPISVYSAVESSERVAFRLLHRKDHAPIKYKKFCSKERRRSPERRNHSRLRGRGRRVRHRREGRARQGRRRGVVAQGRDGSPAVRRLRIAQSALVRQPVLRGAARGRREGLRSPAGRAATTRGESGSRDSSSEAGRRWPPCSRAPGPSPSRRCARSKSSATRRI